MNIATVISLAQKAVDVLPERAGRAVFDAAGIAAGLSNLEGVRQLRANQKRVLAAPLADGFADARAPKSCPVGAIRDRLRSVAAMRSYMRYYYEALRLPSLSRAQIEARVRVEGLEHLADALETGSVAGALMHAGNWDLAGAWATATVAPVHTIAEKLDPKELFEGFLSLREGLGMRIVPLEKGGGALHAIVEAMREGTVFAPLLADRDLAASGIEVDLCGHRALVAPGPALLAQRTGRPIVPVYVSYERLRGERARRAGTAWGIVLHVESPVRPQAGPEAPAGERRADLVRMTRQWIDALEPHLRARLADWHMLQKVFVADLDPERLARARARAANSSRDR